ncbi:hypothetical protein MMC20_000902 [Loxospora ochrophaea]|nr:hypothetical protein [Loxospora ochrophaea]
MASDHCKRDVSPRPSRFPRLDLRQATVALAKKCEHLKRIVTLQARDSSRNSPGYGFPSERSPLLSRSGSQTSVVGRSTVAQRLTGWSKSLARDAWSFATSVEGQGIFKCSIAYALGVGAALVPALTAVLGPQRGKHMVPVVIGMWIQKTWAPR